ncbi:MAG TPA: diguanylate cyclase [Desulfuromonadales bacterium]|nr:diguanylate cyclase [Desulfuromonadales bacterium]
MDKRFRILAVDDEYVNIQLIKSVLGGEYDILTAQNGHEAIDQIEQDKPDLILLDVMMPDITGFEVCKIIKADERFADIPVIFLTGLDTLEGQLQGLELGGIDYLTKPINLALFRLRVRNHLAVKEQRDLLVRQKAELEAAFVRIKQTEKAMSDNLQFVTTLLDTVPSPIFYKDASCKYLGCNRAYTQLTGLSPEYLLGKTFSDIAVDLELAANYHTKDQELLQNPGIQIFEQRVQVSPGEFRDFEYYKSTYRDASGTIAGLVCVKLDITERKRAEEEQIKFNTVVDCLGEGISIKDLDFRIQYQNRSVTELFGDLIGSACYEVFGRTEPCQDCPTIKTLNDGRIHSACRSYQQDGVTLDIESTASLLRDARGEIIGSVEIVRDISERIRNEQTIREMAFHDPLTGLANRRLFEDRLEQAIANARRHDMKFGLMSLDLDHFKEINDSIGHEAGDLVLIEAAERIKTCCKRDSDTISRQGGDEFCIIIDDCGDREQLTAIAEKLLIQFSQPFQLAGSPLEVTTSIGISIFPDNGSAKKELEILSDRAMYAAKKAGRNTYRFWEPNFPTVALSKALLDSTC